MVSYILFLQCLTFIFNFALGVFILSRNSKKNANRAFGIFSFGVAGWNISIFLTIVGLGSSLFWGRIAWTFASFMAAGLLWFVHLFPQPTRHAKYWGFFSLFTGAFFAILGGSPLMVKSVAIVNGYITGQLNPSLYYAWDAFFLFFLIYSLIFSWIRTLKASGIVRLQSLQVSFGVSLFVIPFLVTNIVLPLVANDFRWNNLGPLFTMLLIGFVARAIIQYRFLDIKWVLKRGADVLLEWFAAFAAVSGIQFLLRGSFSPTLIEAIIALCIATFYLPISKVITSWSEKMASRGSYHYRDAVVAISEIAHMAVDLRRMLKNMADHLEDYFGFSRIGCVAFTTGASHDISESYLKGFSRTILKAAPEMIRLVQINGFEIFEANELRWRIEGESSKRKPTDVEVLRFLRTWNIAIIIPLVVGSEVVGLIFVGEKSTPSVLTDRDISLLHVLQGSIAPAISNGVRFAEMQRLYTQLALLDQAKSDFISVVSHQFRTPLTSILWGAELALDGEKLDKQERKTLEEIHHHAEYLNATLSDILDMLELDNRRAPLEKRRMDFAPVVRSAVERVTQSSAKKHIRISLEAEVAPVLGNERQLASMVYRLLRNAFDYTPRDGQVSISLRPDAAMRKAVLTITDSGIGIPPKELPHVFEKFYRASNAKLALPNGAGIGMHLAKLFVDKHHGSIEITSKLGVGTTVTVSLPMTQKV